MNNDKLTMPSHGTASSDADSEERLRASLSRMGQMPAQRQPQHHQMRLQGPQPRRRFVRDGEVPIQYAPRTAEMPMPADTAETDSARAGLAVEQAARHEAEAALAAARNMIRTLQTRLGHAELELQEARERAERAEAAARAAEVQRPARSPRVARPVLAEPDPQDDDFSDLPEGEPQPVKWWIRK